MARTCEIRTDMEDPDGYGSSGWVWKIRTDGRSGRTDRQDRVGWTVPMEEGTDGRRYGWKKKRTEETR
jgi:hypothetical protein